MAVIDTWDRAAVGRMGPQDVLWSPEPPPDLSAQDFASADRADVERLLIRAMRLTRRLSAELGQGHPPGMRGPLKPWLAKYAAWLSKRKGAALSQTGRIALSLLAEIVTEIDLGFFQSAYGEHYAMGLVSLLGWLPWASGLSGDRSDTSRDKEAWDQGLAREMMVDVRRLTS